jgi:hypothetical protein
MRPACVIDFTHRRGAIMKNRHCLFGAALFAAFWICLPSAAQAQCPSAGYFRINAQNPIQEVGATLNTTICVHIRTRATQADLKALVIVELLNTKDLERMLFNAIIDSTNCGPFSVFNASGWELLDAKIAFTRPEAPVLIRISGRAKDCTGAGGIRIVYEVPLVISYTTGRLSARLDASRATVRTNASLPVPFAGTYVASNINRFLDGKRIDIARLMPSYVRAFNPDVGGVSLALSGHRLNARVSLSARITKSDADSLLTQGIGTGIDRGMNWFKPRPWTGT